MKINKKDLVPLTFPKIPPYKGVYEYLHSKTMKSVVKKFPEWDLPRINTQSVLVDKTRELYDAEGRLGEKKLEAQKRRQEIDHLWNDLAERENMLRQNFIKFNKFVKENQEKRDRAERKIAEEKALAKRRSADIENLQLAYEYMSHVRSEMDKNIKHHKMYENYLQAVVKEYRTMFRTPDQVLDRYEALAEARRVLADRQETDLTALETAKIEMAKILEENTLEILGLRNTLAELQNRFEVAKNKALHWEVLVTKIKTACVDKRVELHNIQQSCWNLYLQMCKRKEMEPDLDRHDIENQLLFIKRTIFELKRILLSSRRKAVKENRPESHSTKQ